MGKIFILFILSLGLLGFALFDFLEKAPKDLYQKAISGEIRSDWYRDKNLKKYLTPSKLELKEKSSGVGGQWRKLVIGPFRFPMPYRHPKYRVSPFFPSKEDPRRGIIFEDSKGVELVKIILESPSYFSTKTPKGRFYEIPLVTHYLSEYRQTELWTDLFKRFVPGELQGFKQGIRDLYLLEQRFRLFSEDVISFGVIGEREEVSYLGKEAEDKDYQKEEILFYENGQIFRFTLFTSKDKKSARVFRSLLLKEFSYIPRLDKSKSIAHQEFRAMSRKEKVDEGGFLKIYSAWTQDIENKSLLQEMIFYLEMNPELGKALEKAYKYAFEKYGKVFAYHRDISVELDGYLELQRKIELKERRYKREHLDLQEYKAPEKREDYDSLEQRVKRGRKIKKDGGEKVYRVD